MDTFNAILMGEANRGREQRVFDWLKAAQLIMERKPQTAAAGLAEDWFWTAGDIYQHGAPLPAGETYTYLARTWATPQLRLDGEHIDCFRMASETPGWDAKTYWPQEALEVLNALPE